MKNVIITGANGFIGSSLIKKLIKKDVNIIAIDLSFDTSNIPENSRIIKIESNIGDSDDLISKIPPKDYDAFYHFAWQGVNGASKADPIVQNNNIAIMLRCAAIANQLECKKFLCSGTIAERAVESLHKLNKVGSGMIYGSAKFAAHIMLEVKDNGKSSFSDETRDELIEKGFGLKKLATKTVLTGKPAFTCIFRQHRNFHAVPFLCDYLLLLYHTLLLLTRTKQSDIFRQNIPGQPHEKI